MAKRFYGYLSGAIWRLFFKRVTNYLNTLPENLQIKSDEKVESSNVTVL